ncbi:MAG: DUF1553 domain-containing protein [Isosphaeraceae bacterium]|nr:DUF1553 domain-containing protein [Isosphaeraceae bacterium]
MRACVVKRVLLVSAVLSAETARGDDAGTEFFEKKIRPVLVERCEPCHAAGAKKLGGGLLLDHREGVRQGGDSGPAVEPGKPDESLLIHAIRHDDDALKMPPKAKLPAEVIADFETWVRQGAPDPRDKPSARAQTSWAETMRQRATWWSLQPVRHPAVSTPKDLAWSNSPVDRFLLASLEAKGLSPAASADPRTLVRRLSLVLTGLPPAPAQVESFVRACAAGATADRPVPPTAAEALVDSLLASPHFGERWGRHWLDVVHFSETHGNEWNYEVHHAWRYRDYVIRAFNSDLPYDQFIREQIAGDLLPEPRWNETEQYNESLIGTGLYRFGEVNHDDCITLPQLGYDLADTQIDTLSKAFQANTVACARCHDHKLDAIGMADYYALLGVLRSSRLVGQCIDAPSVNAQATKRLRDLKTELRKEIASVWRQDVRALDRMMGAALAKRAKSPEASSLAEGLDPQRLEKWGAVLALDTLPPDDPLTAWRTLTTAPPSDAKAFSEAWRALAEKVARDERERTAFNQKEFVTFADFRTGATPDGWQGTGQALRDGPSRSGDFVIHPEGGALVRAVLPAGRYSHVLSDKLDAALRSPVLPLGTKNISFQVIGQHSSAVRLVSNNCQLNYKNYRALTSSDWQWVTFSPPDDRDRLRTYAELMTMFENPKFPDQLAALGGDKDNYRLPWEKAAANPRSYFGVTRVVLHDGAEPPKAELTHLKPLFGGSAPESPRALAARYAAVLGTILDAWEADRATDDDVHWLDAFLRKGLLTNTVSASPRLASLAIEYRQTDAALAVPRVIAGMSDGGPGIAQPVFTRGDCRRPGDTVPRRFLEVLSPSLTPFASSGSGRLELAERITDPANPLTARVLVNRVWHHLFGTGLVRTVDDFGHVGELPSHPELLDHLATRFVADGWSIKRLIRMLVLTRSFQMADQPSTAARRVDPQNRLLQHYPARRMEAEAVRDAILAASGRLDSRLYGPSVQPYREKEYADRRLFPGPLDGDGRRSVYIKNNLMEAPKFLGAFNFPGGKVTQGRRDVTNVPAQALALLNDPFVVQQAGVWAERLVARTDDSIGARVDTMFQTTLSRPPTSEEQQRFQSAIAQLADLHKVPSNEVLKSVVVWKDLAHALFNVNEFITIP